MAEAENSARVAGRITKEHALTYRDGLIIALLAAVPLRKRTLAALTINQHLVKIGSGWLLDIPGRGHQDSTCAGVSNPRCFV